MLQFIAVPSATKDGLNAAANSAIPFDQVKAVLQELAQVSLFQIPVFKVGTLDSLVSAADELGKSDTQVELIVNKLVDSLLSLLEGKNDQLAASLTVQDKSPENYISEFSWNSIKYRSDKSIKETTDSLLQEISTIDGMLKKKLNAYTNTKNSLIGLERKQQGSLAVKGLSDIVKPADFIQDSEYLKTVLVAVQKTYSDEFLGCYETLVQMIVPRSANVVAEDDEYFLYSTVCFKRVADEFMSKLREKRYIPRDFEFDAEEIAASRKEMAELGASAKEQWATLVRLCKSNFGELFAAWIHIKALRVFVEAILRYGLPPDFQALSLRHQKKIRDELKKTFASLGRADADDSKVDSNQEDTPIEYQLDKDYTPYVRFDVKMSWAT